MSSNESTNDSSSSASGDRNEERGVKPLFRYMFTNKLESCLWLTRLSTIVFTCLYLIPLIHVSACYQRALISSAATSALRLHQRLPQVRLSREFLAVVFLEDSAHYLLYSIIFVTNSAISLSLLPIFLFAFLHFSSHSLTLVHKTGTTDGLLVQLFGSVVEQYQRSILQTVALTEIMLMPCILFALLSGLGSLITPFIYYRFLSLRYTSRRNPYTRQMFHELRLSTEYLIYKPQCPLFIRNAVLALIQLISRLSPQIIQN